MRKKYKKDEIVIAFEIVEQILSDNCQMIDYFYSGDKDTKFEALSNVLKKHGLPDFKTLTPKELKDYETQYIDEFITEFNSLVEFGEEELKKANTSWEYVKKMGKSYQDVDENFYIGGNDIINNSVGDETDLPF